LVLAGDIRKQAAQGASRVQMRPILARPADLSSSIEVRLVDPLSDPDWDRLVLSHPGFNFFHRTGWAKVLCQTYGHKPLYLHFYQADELVGLLPVMEVVSPFTGRRGVSMPFSDFCEPLLLEQWRHEKILFETLRELARERKWSYFEMRGGKNSLPGEPVAAERFYGHKLDLTAGIEKVAARFQSSVGRAIRKAEKSGLTVEVTKSGEAMVDFYRLHERTRRRHGLPPQPFSFFRSIQKEIIDADLGFIVVAKQAMTPIAAAVFFHSGEEALFKFGASNEKNQQLRGNNLVMSEAIKHLMKKGLRMLHFGRTDTGNEGLRQFKLSWGAQEEVIEYFRFALNTNRWINSGGNAPEFHNQIFRRLPLAANRIAGALIYPHLD